MALITNNENFRLKRMAKLVKDKKVVLDIGCADMPNPYLSNQKVISFDIEEHSPSANYTDSIVGDVMNLPSPFQPGQVDAIVAGEIIEHLDNPMTFLRNCRKTLAPNGVLVLSTPNPNSPIERLLTINLSSNFFYTEDHLMLFPQRWLIRMLERSGFSGIRLYSGGFPIPPIGLIPFPRPWCYQTIAIGVRKK